MIKLAIVFAVSLVAFSTVAFASCPWGTRYECVQTYSGKVVCSCR